MSDPKMIQRTSIDAGIIPFDGQGRIGHSPKRRYSELSVWTSSMSSEVLTPADEAEPHQQVCLQKAPFVCGAPDLGEALRRIGEGAAMIRSKGEVGHRLGYRR